MCVWVRVLCELLSMLSRHPAAQPRSDTGVRVECVLCVLRPVGGDRYGELRCNVKSRGRYVVLGY